MQTGKAENYTQINNPSSRTARTFYTEKLCLGKKNKAKQNPDY